MLERTGQIHTRKAELYVLQSAKLWCFTKQSGIQNLVLSMPCQTALVLGMLCTF